MKSNYQIVVSTRGNPFNYHEFNFYCTRSQVDKLFYSFAFALPSSSDVFEVLLVRIELDGIQVLNKAVKVL